MIADTHTHLDAEQFDEDREEVIGRAVEAGISLIVNVGFNRRTIPSTLALAEKYSAIYAVIGWHPQDAIDMKPEDLDWIESLCTHPKVVAIGEIGLDYHWDTSPKDVQARVFREQIQLACRLGKPIVIHNREASEDIMAILQDEKAFRVGGIMHCFSGDWKMAKKCLEMNFYLSFGGPVTFKNGHMAREVLQQVPLDRLLLETDSPYLAPHPYRGKRNETAYVRLVAEVAAELKHMSIEKFAEITTENARRVFSIWPEQLIQK